MATVTELTYNIDIEFPISKQYVPIQIIRGDDVTLRFTQPSGEDWTTLPYRLTVYDEDTRATLGSTLFSSTTTSLTIQNYNFTTDKALVVLENRKDNGLTAPTAVMTVTEIATGTGVARITYDGVNVDTVIVSGWTTDVIATQLTSAVNADNSIGVTANAVGSVITFTSKVEGTEDNGKVVSFSNISSGGITVDENPTMIDGRDYWISTYKTIAHLNFVVFDGGRTILNTLGFVNITQEDDTIITVPYYETGFEVN